MGYNPWYQYGTDVTENTILQQAKELVSSGLAAAGYKYVNLDDGWMAHKRTSSGGALTWNSSRFPHGIPWLAAQVHSLGLKFGIYEAIGTRTCQDYPGSYGHYSQDAKTFAQWGVDFAKIDNCGGLPAGISVSALTADFKSYGTDLKAANPAVVYSEELPVSYLGKPQFATAVKASPSFAGQWRVTADESPKVAAGTLIAGHLAADLHLHGYAGQGHWNDLDMLVGGSSKFGWTLSQEQSQLSVWAEEASPLLLSANIAALSAAKLAALKNPQLIAIDQSGAQAARSLVSGQVEAVVKPCPGGGQSVLLANLSAQTSTGHFKLSPLGLSTSHATSRNVWTGAARSLSGISVTLGAGQTELLVLKGA
jgi:alpha-galactosidase